MNEIVVPDLSGSDSDKFDELFRYTEEVRMELSAEITALNRRLEAVINNMRGGVIL